MTPDDCTVQVSSVFDVDAPTYDRKTLIVTNGAKSKQQSPDDGPDVRRKVRRETDNAEDITGSDRLRRRATDVSSYGRARGGVTDKTTPRSDLRRWRARIHDIYCAISD